MERVVADFQNLDARYRPTRGEDHREAGSSPRDVPPADQQVQKQCGHPTRRVHQDIRRPSAPLLRPRRSIAGHSRPGAPHPARFPRDHDPRRADLPPATLAAGHQTSPRAPLGPIDVFFGNLCPAVFSNRVV